MNFLETEAYLLKLSLRAAKAQQTAKEAFENRKNVDWEYRQYLEDLADLAARTYTNALRDAYPRNFI